MSSSTMKDTCEICGGKCNAKDSVSCSACKNISAHTCCLDKPSLVPKSWKCEECSQETDQYGKKKRGALLIYCETARKALNNSRSLVIKTAPIANTNSSKGYTPSRDNDKAVCTSTANINSFKRYAPSRDKDKVVCSSPIANTNSFKGYAPSRYKEKAISTFHFPYSNSSNGYAPSNDKEKAGSTSPFPYTDNLKRYEPFRDKEKVVSTSNHDSQRAFIPAKPTNEFETGFHEESRHASSRDKERVVGTSNHGFRRNFIPAKPTKEYETSSHKKSTAYFSRDEEKAVSTSPIVPSRDKKTASSTYPTADTDSLKRYAPFRDKEKTVGTSNHNSERNDIPAKPIKEFETSFHEKQTAKNVVERKSTDKFDPRAENNKKSGCDSQLHKTVTSYDPKGADLLVNESENANPPQKLLVITEGTLPDHPVPCANWTGDFQITDTITDSWRDVHDIQAHIPGIVSPKVCETIKELVGKDIEFNLLPRAKIWPKIFKLDHPQFNDIGLYFFPSKDERMKRGFTHCVDTMDQKDLALEGSISSEVKLLVFSSIQLQRDPYASGITTEICMWGVLKVKKGRKKSAASGNNNTTLLNDPGPRNLQNLIAAQSSQFSQKGKGTYNSGENKAIRSPKVLKSIFQYDSEEKTPQSKQKKKTYNSGGNKLPTSPEYPRSHSYEVLKSPFQSDNQEQGPQSKQKRKENYNSGGNKLTTSPESPRRHSHEVFKSQFQSYNQEECPQSKEKRKESYDSRGNKLTMSRESPRRHSYEVPKSKFPYDNQGESSRSRQKRKETYYKTGQNKPVTRPKTPGRYSPKVLESPCKYDSDGITLEPVILKKRR